MWLYIKITRNKYSIDLNQILSSRDKIYASSYRFHKTLGWDFRANTKFGERPRQKEYKIDLIATFGDSFTKCIDVKNNETWQEYLSELLHANVYNFGMGAYGTDQAYLKFLEYASKLKTKIVAMGVYVENINRIVNVYRRFYWPTAGIPMTKPRFILNKTCKNKKSYGKLCLIENPIQNKSEIKKLTYDKHFLHQIGKFDFYYQQNLFWDSISFPYSTVIFSKQFIYEVKTALYHEIKYTTLWHDKESRMLMFELIDQFIIRAKKTKIIPIIIIFPLKQDVLYKLKNNTYPYPIEIILNFCKKRGYYCFNAIDNLVEASSSIQEAKNIIPLHISPQGNKIIAKGLYKFLIQHELLK